MPCVDGREFDDRKREREALDAATRAACEMGRILRKGGRWAHVSEETRYWFLEHASRDEERKVVQPKYS